MPQVIGPQHHRGNSGVPGSGWKAGGEDTRLGQPWGLWESPNSTSHIHPGIWALPESKLAKKVGNYQPTAQQPRSQRKASQDGQASFLHSYIHLCSQILPSLSGTPHFPLQSPNPSLSLPSFAKPSPLSSTRQPPMNPEVPPSLRTLPTLNPHPGGTICPLITGSGSSWLLSTQSVWSRAPLQKCQF